MEEPLSRNGGTPRYVQVLQLQILAVTEVLYRDSCVVSQAEAGETGDVLDDPDNDPPGEDAGAGREVALRVEPGHDPGLVVHDVAALQAELLQTGQSSAYPEQQDVRQVGVVVQLDTLKALQSLLEHLPLRLVTEEGPGHEQLLAVDKSQAFQS